MVAMEALVVDGAGMPEANGLYVFTGNMMNGAPVFQNDCKVLMHREPHKHSGTGQRKAMGWCISLRSKVLYGVPTESPLPPATGWMQFGDAAGPSPRLEGKLDFQQAVIEAATALKEQANNDFSALQWSDAVEKWTRAIGVIESYATDFPLQATLYSNRAEAKLLLEDWEGALADAMAALDVTPKHEKALLRAAVAAWHLQNYEQAYTFADQCTREYPELAEARELLVQIEKSFGKKAGAAKPQGFLQKPGKKMDGLHTNRILQAFSGYSKERKDTTERQPFAPFPHFALKLPAEEAKKKEKETLEAHAEEEAWLRKVRTATENYPALREEYKNRVMELGYHRTLSPLEQMLPAEAASRMEEKAKEGARAAEAEQLGVQDIPLEIPKSVLSMDQVLVQDIDSLFASFEMEKAAEAPKSAARRLRT